jgi:hypothetical protein
MADKAGAKMRFMFCIGKNFWDKYQNYGAIAATKKTFFTIVGFPWFLLGNREKIAALENANFSSFSAKIPGCAK